MTGLAPVEMKLSDDAAISFEEEAARLERVICSVPFMICECCAGGGDNVCGSCMHATYFTNVTAWNGARSGARERYTVAKSTTRESF